jgi:hypothetical protein
MAEKQKPMPEWARDVIGAEPKGFMQDIVQASRLRSQSASLIPDRQRSQDPPRQVSGGTAELKTPYTRDMDRVGEAFAYDAKMAALKVKIETRQLELQIEQAKRPLVESEYEPFDWENMKR